MSDANQPYLYGLVAEFDNPEDLIDAAKKTRSAGYRAVRAHTPYWVKGLGEALALRSTQPIQWLVLGALVAGIAAAFIMQYYTDVISYPLNVGGRPLNSWPAFMIICFELAVLFGAFAAVGGLLAMNGLPLPYHPIFNTPNFELASGDHFYLVIETGDRQFDLQDTSRFLYSLNPVSVSEAKC